MLDANFWHDKENSKKILKEKKLYENLFNSHKQIQNEIKDIKELFEIASNEDNSEILKD